MILGDCALGVTEPLPPLSEDQKPLRYSITLLQLGEQFAENQTVVKSTVEQPDLAFAHVPTRTTKMILLLEKDHLGVQRDQYEIKAQLKSSS